MIDGNPRGRTLVLVVDDFHDGRELVAEILTLEGFDVETAENGERALAAAAERPPDVVVTDLSLPDIDGCEVSRRLKSDERTSGARIIALTAHVGGSYEEEARAAGCDLFMVKPALPKDIVEAIAGLLGDGHG